MSGSRASFHFAVVSNATGENPIDGGASITGALLVNLSEPGEADRQCSTIPNQSNKLIGNWQRAHLSNRN